MRRTSLADAKARLSAIVDDAEHHRRKTVILRHGKPSAVIVPVEAAMPSKGADRPRLSKKEIAALFDALAVGQKRGAVRDLLKNRR